MATMGDQNFTEQILGHCFPFASQNSCQDMYIKCDLMGQNQSHVAIFSYGVKYTSF